jgi:hypothetical protein
MRPRARSSRRPDNQGRSLGLRAAFFVARVALRRLAHSRRSRVVWLGLLLFDAVVIGALVAVLVPRFDVWGLDGGATVERRLWLSCLASWIGSGALAILAVLQDGFGPKATLTFTLPLRPATRLRYLYGNVVLQLGNLWILGGLSFGIAVLSAIGAQGTAWVALFMAGAALAVLGSLLIVSAWVVCFASPASALRMIPSALLAAGALLGATWVFARWTVLPTAAAASFLVVLVAALGGLAGRLGDLYSCAFYVTQGSTPRAAKRRATALFTGWLLRFRSPGAALFVKDLLTRTRHWANWGRVFFAAAAVLAFPLLRATLRSIDDDALLVAVFVVGGVLLTIIDGASSPFGSEGSRLALLLTAPMRPVRLVRAKMVAFAIPFSVVAVATAAGLSLASGLGGAETLRVCMTVLLMVIGLSTVFVLGSVFDMNLDLEIHGGSRGSSTRRRPSRRFAWS